MFDRHNLRRVYLDDNFIGGRLWLWGLVCSLELTCAQTKPGCLNVRDSHRLFRGMSIFADNNGLHGVQLEESELVGKCGVERLLLGPIGYGVPALPRSIAMTLDAN